MAVIQISADLDQRLTKVAERRGVSKAALLVEAIQSRFDELEALAVADEQLKDVG